MVGFAVRKNNVMWGDYEYMYLGFGHLDGQKQIGTLTLEQHLWNIAKFDKGVYSFVFVLAFIGVISSFWYKSKNRELSLLIKFIFCGYYAAYIIGEVQTRYRYVAMPAVFLMIGYGVWLINRKLKG